MKKIMQISLVFILSILLLYSCRYSQARKDLLPPHRDFLSDVRYIITQQEKKHFLILPASDRDQFIKDFWKIRDLEPGTEENEYKEQYYRRIDEANHLFREGGTPGWLQDRGRIYILLGPPDERFVYPTGYRFYDRPSEVWLYGMFPIIFIDESHTQNYDMAPISGQYLAMLLNVQMELKTDVKAEGVIFDFDLKLEKHPGYKVKALIKVPYAKTWLLENEDRLETTLSLQLTIYSGKEKAWNFEQEYPISLTKEDVMEKIGSDYPITVQTTLPPGKYKMTLLLENKADGQRAQKALTFKLD
jgi:GWxTD domain-containing protein